MKITWQTGLKWTSNSYNIESNEAEVHYNELYHDNVALQNQVNSVDSNVMPMVNSNEFKSTSTS